MKSRNLALIAVVSTLGLVACGSDDQGASVPSSPLDTTGGVAAAPAGADFSATDVEFARGMIPHHQQAVEMADIALDPSTEAGDQVTDLATRIKGAQGPEIEMMTGWLTTWGQPMQMGSVPLEVGSTPMSMGTAAGVGMSTMAGMMTQQEMDSLGMLKGAEFDTMWLQMMTRHHEGAITMAQTESTSGLDPDALDLASEIISAQQAELDEMSTLLGS